MVIFNKLPTYYADGTASVDAAGTTVTGTGTVWTVLQPGDLFGVHIGLAVPILEVVSATELTLLFPWPGATQTDADYCVQFVPRSVGVQEATRQLLLMLANGNLDAFAELIGATDKIPIFTGPGTLTLVSKGELTSGVQADKQVATLADRAAYNNSPTDFKVLVSNTGDGRAALYTKLSNASGDWSAAAYITGPTGADGVNPRGFYNAGTAYITDDLVYSGGSTWVAKINTTGNAPPTLPTTENTQWRLFVRAGAAVNPRGDYAAGTAYEPLDAVLYSGSTWIAKIPTTGNAPPTLPTTSNAQWQLMAQKGNDGTGTGDVVGPSGASDNAIATYDGVTGKLIKASTPAQAGVPVRGYISPDFNIVQNATDPDNDLNFPSGVVASEQISPILMNHSAASGIQLDVAYGTGNGGRFDSAISDGTWHCFVISNGPIVSRGLSKSLDPTTQPNYPAGFTHYRRVASWLRSGGVLRRIIQFGNHFWHSIRISDVSDTNPGTAAITRTLTVPIGFPVIAFGQAAIVITSSTGLGTRFLLLSSLSQSDADPNSVGGTIALNCPTVSTASQFRAQGDFSVLTNASGQIRSRLNASEAVLVMQVLTSGWIDYRGTI